MHHLFVHRFYQTPAMASVWIDALDSLRFLSRPNQVFQLPGQRAAGHLRSGKTFRNELLLDFGDGRILAGPGHFECALKGGGTITHSSKYHGLPEMCVF
jgi:hypothetical protein